MVNNTTTGTGINLLDFNALVALLDGNNCCRFVTLTYRAKGTGELARHSLLLNVKRENCLKVDLANLQKIRPTLTGIMAEAADELIESMQETLTTGRNSRYTKHGYYQAQGNGRNAQISIKDVCYIRGYSRGKEVIETGTYKQVESALLTVAKDKLRSEMKNTRLREFRITPENFVMARADGKVLVIDASGSSLNKLANLPPVTLAVPVAAI